jgi:peptidoglycan-N-acetylmuramic acid deacetylase
MKPKAIYKALCASLAILIFLGTSITSEAAQCYHWYLKRNKNAPPIFPNEAEEIKKYNAIYIDEGVDNNNKKIYLTFDAGYENGNVEKILDVLKAEKIPAAFFLLDNIILKNTDLVKRMADEGHLVCNHTKNHKNLSLSSAEEIKNNLNALEKIYEEKTGREMAKFFRFPEGKYSIDALKTVSELGYTTVFWSFAYDDWDNQRQPNREKSIKKVLENTHNGAIMLFHPTSQTNAEIFPRLIEEWKKQGYTFGSLNEIISGR